MASKLRGTAPAGIEIEVNRRGGGVPPPSGIEFEGNGMVHLLALKSRQTGEVERFPHLVMGTGNLWVKFRAPAPLPTETCTHSCGCGFPATTGEGIYIPVGSLYPHRFLY